MDKAYNVVVIGGPTASGKSGMALDLALKNNGVIINADSMQLYNGLALLTAQPSPDDFSKAPHKLYGVLAVDDICSAATWREMALKEINEALSQSKLPIIVGGTGFYINAMLKGMSPIPEVPPEYRTRAKNMQIEMGNPAFNKYLATRDPETASALDPMNTQRNVRAYEVLDYTGRGLSSWQTEPATPPPAHLCFKTIFLNPPREKLYAQCNARFLNMIENGALDEAINFRKTSGERTSPLQNALGYKEICAFTDGTLLKEEMIEKAQQSTRNYAKRQVTWFKGQMVADEVVSIKDIILRRL